MLFNLKNELLYRRKRQVISSDSFKYIPGEWFLIEINTGSLITCSRDFAELIGEKKSFLKNQKIGSFSFQSEDSSWRLKQLDKDLIINPGRYEDVGLKNTSGVPLIVDIWVNHIIKKGRKLAICLVTDKSHQRQLQGELIGKHQELQKAFVDLKQKTKQLEQARLELNKKNKTLSLLSSKARETNTLATIGEIAAELAHQLNNPLAAAIGATRNISKFVAKNNYEQMPKMVPLLESALTRMKDTVEKVKIIYNHTKVSDKPPVALNVNNQLENTLVLLEQKLSSNILIKKIEPNLPQIMARPTLFQHILINIIDNAVEAAGHDGTIRIEVYSKQNKVFIEISDSGQGIDENEYDQIFEPFFSKKDGGSGLGLAAVKRYTERDKATVLVGSSKLGGAIFTISYNSAIDNDADH